jgi:hypothetical protein
MKLKVSNPATSALGIEVIEWALALKQLEQKIEIMESLNSIEDEPEVLELRIKGTQRKIKVDIKKLREAVTFEDYVPGPDDLEEIKEAGLKDTTEVSALENETEDVYLARVKAGVHLRKTDKGTLVKESMIKLFKCVGEYVRLLTKEVKISN